jgi:hypothetical protein
MGGECAITTNPSAGVNWQRVALEAAQIAIGIGLMFLGAHGGSFGDGATTATGAILVGSGARGIAGQ